MEDKNLQLDRLVFFCDAVAAIAITLLAFNLKIDHTVNGHLSFADIFGEWKPFLAFLLSFVNIASFWKNHHTFFSHFKKIDERLLWYNIWWLFFIVLLPFTTSLVSAHFVDTPAMFSYSLNIFLIACFQNLIWDYTSARPDYLKENTIGGETIRHMRLYCNLDMINGLLAVAVSFISPTIAFILLLTKLPMLVIAMLFFRSRLPVKKKRQ